jgi:Na+/melibiose symporter-like transporter
MGALGFVAGVVLTAMAFRMDADHSARMGIAIVLLVVAALLSIMVFAILKIALVQRLEHLQKEIKKLERGDKPATSP